MSDVNIYAHLDKAYVMNMTPQTIRQILRDISTACLTSDDIQFIYLKANRTLCRKVAKYKKVENRHKTQFRAKGPIIFSGMNTAPR